MKRKLAAALVVGLVIGFVIGALGPRPEVKANPSKPEGWEYKTVLFARHNAEISEGGAEKKLNDLAKDGWEYAGPVYPEIPVIAFKRLKK